jgi:hypothetical protein
MKYLVLMGAIFPILIIITTSHQIAFGDPKHCHLLLLLSRNIFIFQFTHVTRGSAGYTFIWLR